MTTEENPPSSASDAPEAQRFARLWDKHSARVQAYAIRRVGPEVAEEIVAETFLVAWRRLADIPGDPLPWLLVVARNTIWADRRSRYRARAVEQELARLEHLSEPRAGVDVPIIERDAVLRALATLTRRQREALLLVSWEGLTNDQAAAVVGCTPGAFKVRLHRARERLRRAAEARDDGLPSPDPNPTDVPHVPRTLPEGIRP